MYQQTLSTPCGPLIVKSSHKGLTQVVFDTPQEQDSPNAHTRLACNELTRYLAGHTVRFSVPLDAAGTAFQQQVWQALVSVPYGETRSYKDIAAQLNNPSAMRAVGAANGRNPVAIIVPCHRIVGANKRLTGYAGGLWRKQFLLELEGINDICH